ncbi:MAG TPA: BON domain-containing protein [Calidithermus sp.]|nr:BON domain-containing protein [Calidithermus sp.]
MAGKGTLVALAVVAGVVLAGCQTVTGRSLGQWWEDKATTAKVKTALASKRLGTLTRVDVDTYAGTVYLTGTVRTEEMRRQIEEMAQSAAGGRQVVSRLAVAGETVPAASPGSRR